MAKVVIGDCYYKDVDIERRLIEGSGHELVYCNCKTEDELIQAAADADVLIVQFAPVTRRVISQLKHCQLICRYAIGMDIIDIPAATERGIYVANVPDYCLDEVSNHAIALLLCMVRKIPQISASVKEGKWDYTIAKPLHRTLGKTLGILGFGRLGTLVSSKMVNFGMDIITSDPWIHSESPQQHRVRKVSMETLLQTSDYLSLHVPLNNDTYHLLDDAQFAMMKPGVMIVNTSRGPVINEKALVRALDAGIVSGVALDVTEIEPLPANSPLLNRDNVILTPHVAWYSNESIQLLQRNVAEEALRVLNGQLPLHLVNQEVLRAR